MQMNQGQIDLRYIIKEKIGSGGTANIFLVEEIETNREYVAKVLKNDNNNLYINEVYILNILRPYNSPYIINIINSGEGNINRNNRNPRLRKYAILEYAPYGNIYNFLYAKNNGLGELYSKIIFFKIMRGIQFCHDNNICHRDMKLQNILLDGNFYPKICDFGFACVNAPNLIDKVFTPAYKPPEIGSRPYDGKKADIFSLGASLILLVTGKDGFKEASAYDKLYNKIMVRHINVYWKLFDNQIIGMKLSPEFKDLYIRMVTYNPSLRPSAEEVLNHPWFNEINEMNVETKEKIENEIREVFMKLVDTVKNNTQREIVIANKESERAIYNRACSEDKNYFDNTIKPKYDDTPLVGINMNNYIKLKGNLDPVKFMNCFVKEIEKEDCLIKTSKNKLEFKVIYEDEVDEEEEKIPDEIKEELKKLGIQNEIKVNEVNNELTIQIKLYQCSEGYMLRFVQKGGNRKNFLDKFDSISKSIKNIIK